LKELSPAVEEALVKCLEMCAEFQYPLKRKDLQDLVQSYVVEHNIQTRWLDDRPGREWVRLFQKRWSHRIKIRKPRNIKRSRAQVSPKIVSEFFVRLGPNLQDIPPSHVFNYNETCIKDDPGSADAFFGGGTKYYEQVMNHSRVGFSVMFCIRCEDKLVPVPLIFHLCSISSSVF
jgi:hypothetical protein